MVNRRNLLKLSALGTASFAAPLAYSASKITMAYNTGNPPGSSSPKDLIDNAEDFDYLLTGTGVSHPNRLGVPLKSWKGMEGEHNADQVRREAEFDASQAQREDVFDQYLEGSGWTSLGGYAPGISIVSHSQTVEYGGQPYALKASVPASISVPYITTGDWATENVNFKLVGDNSLRQDLAIVADPSKGAGILGRASRQIFSWAELGTVQGRYQGDECSLIGYYANSPGKGGGILYWDATSVDADDGGSIRKVTGVTTGRWKRKRKRLNVFSFGAIGDKLKDLGGTDDSSAFEAHIAYCEANQQDVRIPSLKSPYMFLVTRTMRVKGPSARGDDAHSSFIYCPNDITVFQFSGSRRKISDIHVWFGLANAQSAIGFMFGSNDIGTASDQFSCNIVENLYVRNAKHAYACNSAGTTGTVWNNTFTNCRSDFSRSWAWNFNSIVGSTSQTWINCMVDGIELATDMTFSRAAGWYTHNIDDVTWIACQADEMYNGACIYVNLASVAKVSGFRTEGSYLRTANTALIYINARSGTVEGIKVQVLNCSPAPSGAAVSVVRLSTIANVEVGDITLEQCNLGECSFYKIDSNSIDFGFGTCTVRGASTLRGEVRSEDSGMRTFYSRGSDRYAPTGAYPSAGTFERGDTIKTAALSAPSTVHGKVCLVQGTIGAAPTALVNTIAGSRVVTVASGSGITPGTFVTIAGVTGIYLVRSIATGVFYIDSPAGSTVTGAAVALAVPVFHDIKFAT